MKILLLFSHDGFVRMFEPMIRQLAARGHELNIGVAGRRAMFMSEAESLEVLCNRVPGLTFDRAPKGRDRDLADLELAVTAARDYLRFLRPPFEGAFALRERARDRAPRLFVRLVSHRAFRHPAALRLIDRLLERLEAIMPESPKIVSYIRRHDPDVVLVSPLVGLGSAQPPLIRSARRLGVPTALLVHSWDNLTNKGLIHDPPDRVVVWNEAQRREAVELHGIPEERVDITGAQGFDHWFDREPGRSWEQFADAAGLDAEHPYLLYVCSSQFIAPDEVSFLRRWLSEVRGHERLRDVGVMIRPHPQHKTQWEGVSLDDPRAVVWPPVDDAVVGRDARQDYFDSIHHARAIVGINTSALIEAAIQRRPVFTIRAPEFRGSQGGTLHFGHLTGGESGGFLRVADSFPEHLAQLAETVADASPDDDRAERFLEAFVRPHGLDQPATDHVVRCVEALREQEPQESPNGRWWHPAARRALAPTSRAALALERRMRS